MTAGDRAAIVWLLLLGIVVGAAIGIAITNGGVA